MVGQLAWPGAAGCRVGGLAAEGALAGLAPEALRSAFEAVSAMGLSPPGTLADVTVTDGIRDSRKPGAREPRFLPR